MHISTIDSPLVPTEWDQPVETINPATLEDLGSKPSLGLVLGSPAQPLATESISSSDELLKATAVNSETADILQPCFDERLAPLDPALQVLDYAYNLKPPCSHLEHDDASQSSPEMFWLEQEEEDAPGVSSEDTSLADDASWLIESFEMFIRSEDNDTLQSSPEEEWCGLLESNGRPEPNSEEIPRLPPLATIAQAPSRLPESVEGGNARLSAEPETAEPSPGADSDLDRGGSRISELPLAVTADSTSHDRVHECDTGDGTPDSPAQPQSFEAQKCEIGSRDRSDDGDIRSQGRPSLAEQNDPASALVLEAQQSKIVLRGGSNGDEARFVPSRKRKRDITSEDESDDDEVTFVCEVINLCGEGVSLTSKIQKSMFNCSNQAAPANLSQGKTVRYATTVPPPTDLPDSTENVTAMPPVEPVLSKPSPGAASAASDLGQEAVCMSILSSEFATDDRVHENDTAEDRTSNSPACSQSFEAQQSKIESGDGSGDYNDVHSQERSSLSEKTSPVSPGILETQLSKIDFGDGGNEIIFVRSRKRKRPPSTGQNSPTSPEILESNKVIFVRSRKRQRSPSAEQNRPARSHNFEAQQSKIESGDRSGDDEVIFFREERASLKRACTKNPGGMFLLPNTTSTYQC